MNQHHNPTLDGVRDLAILAVVIFHTMSWYPYFGMGRNVIRAISLGWMGVDLFFVLSGFLITRILLETRQASNRVKSFYARRALRIFPVYYLVLVSIWILAVCHPGTSFLFAGRAWSNRLAYAAYVQNWLVPFNVKYVSWNIIGQF